MNNSLGSVFFNHKTKAIHHYFLYSKTPPFNAVFPIGWSHLKQQTDPVEFAVYFNDNASVKMTLSELEKLVVAFELNFEKTVSLCDVEGRNRSQRFFELMTKPKK